MGPLVVRIPGRWRGHGSGGRSVLIRVTIAFISSWNALPSLAPRVQHVPDSLRDSPSIVYRPCGLLGHMAHDGRALSRAPIHRVLEVIVRPLLLICRRPIARRIGRVAWPRLVCHVPAIDLLFGLPLQSRSHTLIPRLHGLVRTVGKTLLGQYLGKNVLGLGIDHIVLLHRPLEERHVLFRAK